MKTSIFNKGSDGINILRAKVVYSYASISSLFFGGLFAFFGKDYLVNNGKIIFISCTLIGVSLMTFTFIKLQAKFVRAATELRRTAEEEEFERHRTLTLINSIKDAVILVDEAGYISLYNAATLDLLDTNVGISRKLISEVIGPDASSGFDIMKSMREVHGSVEIPYKRIAANGEILNLNLIISRAKSGYGKIGMQGFVVVMKKVEQTVAGKLQSSVDMHALRNSFAVFEGSIENALLMLKNDNKDGVEKSLNTGAKAASDFKAKVLSKN